MRNSAHSNSDEGTAAAEPGKEPVAPEYMALTDYAPELEQNKVAFAFWKSLTRRSGDVPLTSNCDILEIAELLPFCLMLGLKGPTTWPVMMFGTELVFHFGIDVTGMNGYDLYSPVEKIQAAKRLAVMQERREVMITHNVLRNAGGVTIVTEWLFLPLSAPNGKIDRVLISIASFETPVERHNFEMEGSLADRRLLRLIYAGDSGPHTEMS